MVSVSKLPLYLYKKDGNVPIEAGMVESSEEVSEISFLHNLLLGQWENRMERGIFRYVLTTTETKVISGQYGFIVQLNEERLLKKRPTEFKLDQVLQPFDDNKFNFTKIAQEEVLFMFEQSSGHKSHFVPSASVDKISKSPNVVAINVSVVIFVFAFSFCCEQFDLLRLFMKTGTAGDKHILHDNTMLANGF